jgi:hypothetical protein
VIQACDVGLVLPSAPLRGLKMSLYALSETPHITLNDLTSVTFLGFNLYRQESSWRKITT